MKEIGIIGIIGWRGVVLDRNYYNYYNFRNGQPTIAPANYFNYNNFCPFFSVRMALFSLFQFLSINPPTNFCSVPSPPRGELVGGFTLFCSSRLPGGDSRPRCCSSRAGSARGLRRGRSSSPAAAGHTPGCCGCSRSTCVPPPCC